ncbi:MAG: hypothetical protein KGL39_25155 [Patescibacteria group bacterium]|nr:hypothetical protein [Patescibacteria group bacterium]
MTPYPTIDLLSRENGPKSRWLPVFLDFLSRIKITSKEKEEPGPLEPYEAQLRFLEFLCDGLDDDVHSFTCLKARQLGLSTILLALDIFWLFVHPGLQGALIADTADNTATFRATITEMLESLPPGFQVPVSKHNRVALVLANGSRLQYMSAGKRKNSSLGRSRALNFVHASEASSWGDLAGLESLRAALAQENPNRLYVFESTALGYNLFYDMCEEAREDPGQRLIFLGWWAKDIYRFKRGSAQFDRYWNLSPRLTELEQRKTKEVLELYNHEITPEQWAWYRWMATQRGEVSLHEEFPTTENDAFQSTGSSFFNTARIATDVQFVRSNQVTFNAYNCELGDHFNRLKVERAPAPDVADLRVWEPPVRGARYVMGVDPAYGSSEEADRSAIEICRCYADKLVQVAEYATPIPTTQQCAWVMAYLAACYPDCMINLEITGGSGSAVMAEIKYLKQQVRIGQLRNEIAEIGRSTSLDNVRWFLYHRVDSTGGGYMYNWKTTGPLKMTMFNRLRDAYNTDQLIIRSIPLLSEMTTLEQNGDKVAASGRNKDDRAFAMGLANYAWTEWVRTGMMAENRTFARESARERAEQAAIVGGQPNAKIIDNIVTNFFRQQEAARSDAERRRLIEG